MDNGRGIAGLAPSARLLVAKVVRDDGTVSPKAEARAIRWAVKRGAKVINVSLGSVRDPEDGDNSGFSWVEQRAVNYATRHGALVVAAVGNSTDAPAKPWRYASYPAALPHVLGVGSYDRSGDVSSFSNRDAVYVDLIAPGEDIFSLFPRAMTNKNPSCSEQGYSSCGPKDYRHASGTSFSAPQVASAAAMLFALRPGLSPDQVSTLIERSAMRATPANGCSACSGGRDALSGWGKLDVTAAVHALRARPLPVKDRFEPNDDIGSGHRVRAKKTRIRATNRLLGRPDRRLPDQARQGPDGLGGDRPDSERRHLAHALEAWPRLACGRGRVVPRGAVGPRPRRPGAAELPREADRLVLARGLGRAAGLRLVLAEDQALLTAAPAKPARPPLVGVASERLKRPHRQSRHGLPWSASQANALNGRTGKAGTASLGRRRKRTP